MRDLYHALKIIPAIDPDEGAADNTAKVSDIIDTAGHESLLFAISTGSLVDADATFAVLVEDGDDSGLSDAAAVADENLLGTEALAGFTFADDGETRKIGYIGPKRYVRLTITPTGNAGAWDSSAVAIQGHSRHQPSQTGDGADVTQTP